MIALENGNKGFESGRSRGMYLVLAIIAVFILVALSATTIIGLDIAQLHNRQLNGIISIRTNAALAHLWLEEILEGDTNESIGMVWGYFDQADEKVQALLETAEDHHLFSHLDENANLKILFLELQTELQGVRQIAEKRYAAGGVAGIGSEIDQLFDSTFRSLLTNSESIEERVLTVTAAEFRTFRLAGAAVGIGCVLLALVCGTWLRRYELQRIADLKKILEGEEELNATNEDLIATNEEMEAQYEELTASTDDLLESQGAQRESEERMELALAGANLGTWDWNVKSGEVIFNNRWAEMLGYTLDEIERNVKFWENLVHPDDLPAVMAVWDSHVEGKTDSYETEHRVRHKSGKWVWVLDKGKVIELDEKGNAERACGTHLDITERKQMELALKRTQFSVDKTSDAAYWMGPDARFMYVNEAACKALGYTQGELLSMTVHDIDPGFPVEAWAGHWADLRKNGSLKFEGQHLRKDGSIFPVEIVANFVEFEGEEYNCAFARDITERKQAEEAFALSENQHRTLVESVHAVPWRVDPTTGEFLFMGKQVEEFLGYPAESWTDVEVWKSRIHEDDREAAFNFCMAETAELRNHAFEYRAVASDGRFVWLRDIVTVIRRNGKPSELVGFMLDITDLKKAEEDRLNLERQVLQAQKLESLGIMAGGIAHDFNNLLMIIMGNADLALDQLSPHAPARGNIAEIETASKRAAGLAKQMLAYSGKGKFSNEAIWLNEFVKEMSHLLDVSISKKAVLKFNYADNLPAFHGDASQIRQIIMNLIVNASEAVGETSGIVSISTGAMDCTREYLDSTDYLAQAGNDDPLPEGIYIYLEVADTGCGMDKDTLEKIFDPFFTTKFTGRGLGLAATLGIVRGHFGAIKVYSEVRKGTTFKVLFPASETDESESDQPGSKTEDKWHGSGLVLIADDEESVRAIGRQMLVRRGFDVLTACDGREAVELFRKHKDEIICVILDLTMPHLDGNEAFREMRTISPKVKVLLSSGYNEQEATQRFTGKGLSGFIHKPFSMQELFEKLKQVLEGKGP